MLGYEDCGIGRIVFLAEGRSIRAILRKWTVYVGIPSIRVALPDHLSLDSVIGSIAICVGSGASVLSGVTADLYFTGEMSHHDILKANGSHQAAVLLTEHTNCERGYLKDRLLPALNSSEPLYSDFAFVVSKEDCDPIRIVTL